jgi:tetratricopeptide (TPR) repeat protein
MPDSPNSLIYISELGKPESIIGCGAVIEGPYIATCRHVWRDALGTANGLVTVLFPFFRSEGGATYSVDAAIKDEFEYHTPPLDFVLLGVNSLPDGLYPSLLATEEAFEVGPATVQTYSVAKSAAIVVRGDINRLLMPSGLRQISGDSFAAYWTERGSSGSPVFLENAKTTIAGFVSKSEVGSEPRHEAFIVPATTIRSCLAGKQKEAALVEIGSAPGKIDRALPGLDTANIPLPQIQQTIQQAIIAIKRKADDDLSNTGKIPELDEARRKAAKRLSEFDTDAALEIWEELLRSNVKDITPDKEEKIEILSQKAIIEALRFNYVEERKLLYEIVQIDLTLYETWAKIGEFELDHGTVEQAIVAFSSALESARLTKNERDVTACQIMLADAQLRFGNADEALRLSEEALGARRRLSEQDSADKERLRDLFVALRNAGRARAKQNGYASAAPLFEEALLLAEKISGESVGDVRSQRDLAVILGLAGDARRQNEDFIGARKAYDQSLSISQFLLDTEPANTEFRRDVLIALGNVGDMYYFEADLSKAVDCHRQSLEIARKLFAEIPGDKIRQIDVANCLNQMAMVLRATDDLKGAIANIEEGLTYRKRLSAEDPKNGELSHDVCLSLANLASAKIVADDHTVACERLSEASGLIRQLTEREPENYRFKRTLENIEYEISQASCPK